MRVDADEVKQLEHIWTTEAADWVLVRVSAPSVPAGYLPLNKRTQMALAVDDEELQALVIERMLSAGVPVEDA